MRGTKLYAIFAAAFMAGAFVASPELRAYAANTVGSIDIIDGSIQSVDIGNGQVKAVDIGGGAVNSAKIADNSITAADIGANAVGESEIAADAVGGSELIGVTKLLFGQCTLTNEEATTTVPPGGRLNVDCIISGVDSDDSAIVTRNAGTACFDLVAAVPQSGDVKSGFVTVVFRNECSFDAFMGHGKIGIIVFDK
ncbi:MAG: hypothetical protein ACREBU_06825 [Nitrososphaera sp.]